ncbi:MAG: class I SAM-dependent methyltransferase, partial [Dehalococcoidia bacterium]
LSVAARVAPAGDVTCTEIVPEMVAVAQANAADANVANIKFQQVDAESIPFPDASFDRVVSRFGVMFFPDTQKALGEIRRVLKPGARATFAMWQTTAKNPWFEEINAVVARSGHFTPPPPGMPTPFRFGEAGSLPSELRSAGFEHVSEKPHEISWSWPGSPEEYLEFVEGTMPAFRKALESSGADAKRVKEDMLGVVAQHYDGERVSVPGNIFVVTAQKPG